MMRISPFTPLFFSPSDELSGRYSRYTQIFAQTDRILVEVLADTGEEAPTIKVNNLVLEYTDTIVPNKWEVNADTTLYFIVLSGLSDGYYTININEHESEEFVVTSNEEELAKTTLIQYANVDNTRRDDVLFEIARMRYFFDYRVHGGFKDSGWSFGCNSEQFTTQHMDIVSIYAREFTTRKLTIGTQHGVQVWHAEHLNRLLTCEYVYVNGIRYARKDSNTPELSEVIEGSRSFVINQLLQKVAHLEPTIEKINNQLIARTVNTDQYRVTGDGNSPLII